MSRVTLLTGGNEGDVEAALGAAREMVEEWVGRVVFASSVRRSAPWGVFDAPQQDFLNQVLVVETALQPLEVLEATQGIERELGRRRGASVETGSEHCERNGSTPGVAPSRAIFPENRPDRRPDPSLTLGMTEGGGVRDDRGDSTSHYRAPLNDGEGESRVYSSRPIDIDILYYDNVEINTLRLTIPHPRIGEREFVRVLLEELPEWVRG